MAARLFKVRRSPFLPSCDSRTPCRALVVPMALLAGFIAGSTVRGAPPSRLGQVEFRASGAASAQPHFQRGIAALHSFWYEEALEAFNEALAIDPRFAMARWGVAMTHYRPYLSGSDDAAGRRALAEIRDRLQLPRREVAYIEALETYFSDRPMGERTLAYASAMQSLHRDYPEDLEAAAFFALSLLGYGWATDEGLERQERAASLALEVHRRSPSHPGAAHYLIHSLDEPSLAARGLQVAREYARIAPDSPHALHMPSHIFLHLGQWSELTASNEKAWEVSERWVRDKGLTKAHRDYHTLHWLIYGCLQQGRYAQAAALVERFRAARDDLPRDAWHFLFDAVAAYIVETRQWALADVLFDEGMRASISENPKATKTPELCGAPPREFTDPADASVPAYVRALAAAMRGAAEGDKRFAALTMAARGKSGMPMFWGVRTLVVRGMLRAQKSDTEGAIADLSEAATIEDRFRSPPGPPSAIKPPHELLGEILLAAGRPLEAVRQFQRALDKHPNRVLAVLGRARAEAAAGQPAESANSYRLFQELWAGADPDRPELAEARIFVARKK